jgi:hypothetical protein
MTTNPAQSRFQILQLPPSFPGKCAVCGAVDRPVIDFKMELEYYGGVFFCITCMEEAATKIDYVPVATLFKVTDELKAATAGVEAAYQSIMDFLGTTNESFASLRHTIISKFRNDGFVLEQSTQQTTINTDELKPGSCEDSRQVDRDSVDEGSASVSSNTSNESTIFSF